MKRLKRWLRYLIAAAGHYSGLDALYRRRSGAGLVVLMLHRIRDEPDPYPLSTSPGMLRQLLQWLRRSDVLVGLDDGLRALASSPSKNVNYAITLDDGYRDNLSLLDFDLGGAPAVVYLATDHVGGEPIWAYRIVAAVQARGHDLVDLDAFGLGRFDLSSGAGRAHLYRVLPERLKHLHADTLQAAVAELVAQLAPGDTAAVESTADRQMLDWDEVRKLRAGGVLIGGHTRKHVLLSRVEDQRARDEIAGSHQRLVAELGAAPQHFAYPNGRNEDFGERDVQLVRDAGFTTAVTTVEGVNRPDTDRFRLRRYNVHEARFRSPWGRLSRALFFSETSGLLGWLQARRAA